MSLGSYENTEALPLVELDLSKLPKGTPRIASLDVKFEKDTDAYKLTKSAPVEGMDDATVEKLQKVALAAYRAVKLRDYGRIDMRLSEKGKCTSSKRIRIRGSRAHRSSRWPPRSRVVTTLN